MTFARLRPADWVVFIAALALLFTTAFDWYSTVGGDEARRIQQQAQPDEGQPSGQIESEVERDAAALAESKERNAWQVDETIDRVILICLLVTSALGVLAAFWRARPADWGPYDWTGLMACISALLVLYRILQEPRFDALTTVKIGAPLALGVLGVLAFASATSLREGVRAEPESAPVG